jgi:hypothetical protein
MKTFKHIIVGLIFLAIGISLALELNHFTGNLFSYFLCGGFIVGNVTIGLLILISTLLNTTGGDG